MISTKKKVHYENCTKKYIPYFSGKFSKLQQWKIQSIPLSNYPIPSIFEREILVKLFQKGFTWILLSVQKL